ncbi:2131_t:CDS:2 [Cetraspora pellucida]|uniref:5-formyltetrahydrofolate cyclo-ligase n=1 Tax=Cetraspora pellucida TaxID=1433469 RepID=A0A9N9DR79_9GLOM|nr:2131_t:CDS:2 [Cetraspora pellucida]
MSQQGNTLTKKFNRREIMAMLKLLNGLSSDKIAKDSILITTRIMYSEEYQKSRSIAVYLSGPNEFSTESIIHDIFSNGKKCYVPSRIGERMEMVKLESLEDYRSIGPNNLDELGFLKHNNQNREIGIAYDFNGNRLSNDNGSYDGYLARCQKWTTPPKTMAPAFDVQILREEELPVTEYAQKPDIILTPTQLRGSRYTGYCFVRRIIMEPNYDLL